MTFRIQKLNESEFPELLKEIPDKPKSLYYRGTLPKEGTKLLSIVGSRKYSPYGKSVCEKLVSELSGYDIAIISGLALGMDSIAHKAALQAGLKTIAIPGSGLSDEVLYPRSHLNLAHEILKNNGVLISEYEPNQKAALYTFPRRNRIMAGLSHAVLIIEAEDRSGSLITARLATEYNRDVMTVPGSIFSKQSEGTNKFIRLGATPVTSSADILETLGIKENQKTNNSLPKTLSENEKNVLKIAETPVTKNELVSLLGISISDANVLITSMELKGLLSEKLGKIYTNSI